MSDGKPTIWDELNEGTRDCTVCEGSGELQEAESFSNSYGEHGLDDIACWNCVNIRAAVKRGRELEAELNEWKRKATHWSAEEIAMAKAKAEETWLTLGDKESFAKEAKSYQILWAEAKARIRELEAENTALLDLIEHALALGYLGEGSTAGWARDLVEKRQAKEDQEDRQALEGRKDGT